MEHSKVLPIALLQQKNLSILNIAQYIIGFYRNLILGNSDYQNIYVVSEKPAIHMCISVESPNSIQRLAEEILNQNVDDIRRIDKIENPDIHYCRTDQFISFSLESKKNGHTLCTLSFCVSVSKNLQTSIGSIAIHKECFDTFEKAKYFLEAVNSTFSVKYSAIKISDKELNRLGRIYKAPLGWITYFSTDYEVLIPDDLSGIEYEYTVGGKYLILSREDIPGSPEKLDLCKQKLICLMQEIEKISPAYSKLFKPPLI